MSFGSSAFGAAPWAAYAPSSGASASISAPVLPVTATIVNGDTVRDANGELVAATDPIAEEIAFRIGTVLGHFFGISTIGNGAFRVLNYDNRSLVATRDLVTRALQPMVQRGDIESVRVTPDPLARNGTAINFYTVSYEPTNAVKR